MIAAVFGASAELDAYLVAQGLMNVALGLVAGRWPRRWSRWWRRRWPLIVGLGFGGMFAGMSRLGVIAIIACRGLIGATVHQRPA